MTSSDVHHVLPRGRHAAPREVVWESQRERMLEAMAEAVAEKGYGRVAVADVIERARVSRRSFYEQFANKEACFLAAYDEGVDRILDAIDADIAAAGDDPLAGAIAGTRVYLQMLADNPAFARTFLVEVLGAGPAALERRAVIHERFAEQLRANWRGAEEPPAYVFRACVGAVHELVSDALVARGPEALPDLLGEVLEVERRLLLWQA